MSTAAWVMRCTLAGVGAGLAIMAGLAARIAVVVTAGNRWRDLRNL